jgi:hypothetical protein
MSDAARVEEICALLVKRYGDLGQGAVERLCQWLAGTIPYAYPDILEKHLAE